MHITLETDYAIRIVVLLGREKKRIDANSISLQTGVSLRFALKIMRNLVSVGIVKSFKGIQGGYELNIPAEEITLKQVLESVEGEYQFSRCLSKGSLCTNPESSGCKSQMVFKEITNKVTSILESVTIDTLI